ncbi:MAG: class I SAM-dependent methyltransferase [Proteobacteria bacterium]|nr:class I SAM-dependent methyltransferase [Pseudomonadota bacterium]
MSIMRVSDEECELCEYATLLASKGLFLEARAILDGLRLEYGVLSPEAQTLRAQILPEAGEGGLEASVAPRPGAEESDVPCPACGLPMVEHEQAFEKDWLLCPACSLLMARTPPGLVRALDRGEAAGAMQPGHALVHRREYTFCRRFIDGMGLREVLNYGVGWSLVPEALRAQGVDAVGCDLWRPLIEQRKRELGEECFFHRDELPDRRFALISDFEVFEHFTDPMKDVGVLVRHLAESGAIVGSTDFWHGGLLSAHPSREPWYWKHGVHVTAWTWQSMRNIADRFNLGVRFFRGDFDEHSSKCFFVLFRGDAFAAYLDALPKVLPEVYGMSLPLSVGVAQGS